VIGTGQASANNTVTSISQTGVTWTKSKSESVHPPVGSPNYYLGVEIWRGIVGSGASSTLTINLSNTPFLGSADVNEYTGKLFDDVNASSQNNGTVNNCPTGTTATTTQATELLVGAIQAANVSNQTTPTNGFTLLDGVNHDYGGGVTSSLSFLEHVVTVEGTYGSQTTIAIAAPYVSCIATFGLISPQLSVALSSVGVSTISIISSSVVSKSSLGSSVASFIASSVKYLHEYGNSDVTPVNNTRLSLSSIGSSKINIIVSQVKLLLSSGHTSIGFIRSQAKSLVSLGNASIQLAIGARVSLSSKGKALILFILSQKIPLLSSGRARVSVAASSVVPEEVTEGTGSTSPESETDGSI
jgi:hypothetical protein